MLDWHYYICSSVFNHYKTYNLYSIFYNNFFFKYNPRVISTINNVFVEQKNKYNNNNNNPQPYRIIIYIIPIY